MPTLIPLDDYAEKALADYLAAEAVEAEAKAARVKARETLLSFFKLHDADTGTIDGQPVCKLVRSDREIVDSERLRNEEPYTYRRFLKLSTAYYVRVVKR